MSSPGTLRFGQVFSKPSPPPSGYDLIYVKTDDVLYIQDSAGVEVALGSASAITTLTGDVSATGPGSATATVNFVGGASAANIASAALAFSTATPSNIPNTLALRDSSGNFSAGTITATLNGTATNVSGIVAIANGGTGQTTVISAFNALSPMTTLGDIIYENATPSAARLPGNTASIREFLISQGSGGLATAPLWSALVSGDIPNNAANTTGTATNVSGIVAIANGGTGKTTASSAFNALSPMATTGDMIYESAPGVASALTIGSSGEILTVVGGIPTWTAPATNGTVTSVALTVPGVIFQTPVSGNPITTSGTLALTLNTQAANTVFAGPTTGAAATPTFRALASADIPPINLASNSNGGVTGILNIANGGTHLSTTPTNGQVLIGNGIGYALGTLTAGTGISVTNAAGSITITNTQTTAFTTKIANYTILSTDGTIFCDTSGGAFTLTLPPPTSLGGKLYRIIDSTGFFQTNNLTLAPNGAEKIEGLAASKVLQTSWGWFNVTTDGTSWFVG